MPTDGEALSGEDTTTTIFFPLNALDDLTVTTMMVMRITII